MAIVTYPLNNVEFVAEDVEQYFATRKSGVYAEKYNFDIISTSGMSVTIGTGLAWIRNGKFSGKSVRSDSAQSISLDASSASLSRIDRIVLRFSVPNNRTEFAVVKGTPASSPVAPNVTQTESLFELGLYAVTVRAGSSEITTSDILDTRADESVCGIMKNELDTPVTLSDLGGVPTSRKINGKSLNTDVALSASDVGALATSGGTLTGDLTIQKSGSVASALLLKNGVKTVSVNLGTDGKVGFWDVTNNEWVLVNDVANDRISIGVNPAPSQWSLRMVKGGTSDLTAGTSSLAEGHMYVVYE